jgi:glutathione synthase/RimK-type ligase-like ATP-grasp enzyme
LTASDQLAAEAFRANGVHVFPAIWDDDSIDWSSFYAIVVRSPWDYYIYTDRLLAWIDTMEGRTVWNPPKILRWNMNKHYLLDLEQKGVRIPRTSILRKGNQLNISTLRSYIAVDEIVVKPVISASAWNTWRCSLSNFSDEDRQRVKALLLTNDILVQEFMPEITTDGEWSLVFFGEKFSHAVRKYPGLGDFRVQNELGGRCNVEVNPPDDLIRQAHSILGLVETPLLYARVDGVVRNGNLVLMELELFEPSLYFDVVPEGVQRFCERFEELMKPE